MQQTEGKTAIKIAVEQLNNEESREALGKLILMTKCFLKHGAIVEDVIITNKNLWRSGFYSSVCKEILPILKKRQALNQRKSEIETLRQQILD